MRTPTIHPNGTSRSVLRKVHADAREALADAINALARAYPNGRDYYLQGDGAIAAAQREHRDRVERLRSVLRELDVMLSAIETEQREVAR